MSKIEKIEQKILAAYAQAASMREEASKGRRGSNLTAEEAENDADNALAMAQRLAAKYSIDLEELRQRDKAAGKEVSEPDRKRFFLAAGPYLRSRCELASRIAMSMGLRAMLADNGTFVDFIGFPEDAEMAWQIFGLVESQMVRSADMRVKAGVHKEIYDYRSASGHLSAKSYKLNYFSAYVDRIATRIVTARQEAEEEVVFAEGVRQDDGTTTGRVTGALVLVTRKDEVEAYFERLYPVKRYKNGKEKKVRTWKSPRTEYQPEAHRHGRADGAKARIRTGSELGGHRRAIG